MKTNGPSPWQTRAANGAVFRKPKAKKSGCADADQTLILPRAMRADTMGHHDSLRNPGPQRRLFLELERGDQSVALDCSTPPDTAEVSWRGGPVAVRAPDIVAQSYSRTALARTGICGRGFLNRFPSPPGTRPAARFARSGSWSTRAGASAVITLRRPPCLPPVRPRPPGMAASLSRRSLLVHSAPAGNPRTGCPVSPDPPGGPAHRGRPHPQLRHSQNRSVRKPTESRTSPGLRRLYGGDSPVIFLATDSDDVIQAMHDEFGPAVVYQTDVLRTPAGEDEQLHFFRQGDVRFGQDVLTDGLLLAACDRLIHVTSNVATAVPLFNPDLDLHYIGRFDRRLASSGIRSGAPCATRDAARGGSRLKPSPPASETTSPTRCRCGLQDGTAECPLLNRLRSVISPGCVGRTR